jgi:hypothetical protein
MDESKTVVREPTRSDRPSGKEKPKRTDAINFIIDKVASKPVAPATSTTTVSMWKSVEKGLAQANEQMRELANNQIMAQAPSPIRKQYVDDLYATIATETQNKRKMVELQAKELEVKERDIQLQESLFSS